jgi:Fur family ferric uptake transcriptional regulator
MEHKPSGLIAQLQNRGMRITPQRAIIFEAIEKLEGHLTAEEIFEQVQKVNPYVSLATVYRTLELLQEMGLINQTNFGRSQTYFALKDHGPHHHLVCTECARIEEFSDEIFDSVRSELKAKYGFRAYTDHMSIFGVCKNCLEKASG